MQNEQSQNSGSDSPLQPTAPTLQQGSGSHVVMAKPDSTVFLSSFSLQDRILEWAFRVGFATVFLINSWVSVVQPDSFLKLIEENFAARLIGHYSLLLHVITLNDLLLGLLILSGWQKKYVYAWAGLWLAIVTFFKTTSLL